MRILVSGAVLDQGMGGVLRHNQELLPRLAELLAREEGELAVLAPRRGLSIDLGSRIRVIASSIPSGPTPLRALFESRAIAHELRRAEGRGAPYQIVHSAHLPAPRIPAGLRGRTVRTHTVHDLRRISGEISSPLQRTIARPLLARALGEAAHVFAVSQVVREELMERFELSPSRCTLVPNAGDHFTPLERRARPDASILHIGHLEPRKNLELLIHALALAPDLPPLLLAGAAKGRTASRLLERAHRLGVLDRIQISGPISEEELPELYADAACVAIPSKLEGFGIGVLEAQRARTPLAVSTAGALLEIAGDETPHFDPHSPEQCVHALRDALRAEPEDLEQAARRAERFSWDKSAEQFHAALALATP